MANWIENELRVTGPLAAREEFLAVAAGKNSDGMALPISFNALLPVPADEQNPARWSDEHWGVKSEILEWMALTVKSRGIHASFATDGSPPIILFQTISRRFPGLRFRLSYWDEMGGFEGIATISGGTLLHTERNIE